jgi:hypothetical protein
MEVILACLCEKQSRTRTRAFAPGDSMIGSAALLLSTDVHIMDYDLCPLSVISSTYLSQIVTLVPQFSYQRG